MANKCNTCGATVPDNATTCPYCGNAVTPTRSSNAAFGAEADEPSTGLNWLSLFVPLAGLIMYFVFKKDPYDVLMIEFAGTTCWFGYKYKMLGYKKYKILWITYLVLSILALCFFFIWEMNDVLNN